MNKKFFLILLTILLLLAMPISSLAMTGKSSNLLNYDIALTPSGNGQLYWNYGKNLEFFLINGSDSYNLNCLIKGNTTYNFSHLVDRSIIAKPDLGWYFDGFYDRFGSKVHMEANNINLLRVSVKGIYYYDYVYSINNSRYANYTKKKYDDTIKAFLKATYGTSRYKIMATTQLYPLPKKDGDLYPRFKAKLPQQLTVVDKITKLYSDLPFSLSPKEPLVEGLRYKSSNSRVLSVNKTTGLGTIKGEGCATITILAPETNLTLATEAKTMVKVMPLGVNLFSAQKDSKGQVYLKWQHSGKSTGYEISLDDSIYFTKPYSKTVTSSKATSAKVKPPAKQAYRYVRVRAFKKSSGTKLYGPWSDSLNIKSIRK